MYIWGGERSSFQAVIVLVVQYGSTTWILTKCIKKKSR